MPIVLVDAPSVLLALVGAVTPKAVQVAISGLTAGQAIVVTGAAGGYTWRVRGGSGVATGAQLVLTDAAAPINVPVTYTVTVDGQDFAAGPITVPSVHDYVLQSLDGRVVVPFEFHGHEDPRDLALRSTLLQVPGRTTPVVLWDVAAGESGQWDIRTTPTATQALLDQLTDRGPVMLLRTDGSIYDQPAVQYITITSASRTRFAFDGQRLWSLGFVVIDDPEPDQVLPTSTGADFDAAWAGRTGADFDAEWAALTWADFDRTDWTQYA